MHHKKKYIKNKIKKKWVDWLLLFLLLLLFFFIFKKNIYLINTK